METLSALEIPLMTVGSIECPQKRAFQQFLPRVHQSHWSALFMPSQIGLENYSQTDDTEKHLIDFIVTDF